jgi:type IV pilus assembly protein PilN
MGRPNLARRPFLNLRPVWLAGAALALVGVVLTLVSVSEVLSAKGQEATQAQRLAELQARRAAVAQDVETLNRSLAHVHWRSLEQESASLAGVTSQRELVWSVLLADLERVIPWDVRLLSISPSIGQDGSLHIVLAGVAASRDAWLRLLTALFHDPRFADPVPGSEEAPSATNAQGYRFQLRVRYLPETQR